MSTREKILEAARALFNEEGVGGQSAVDIATAQGISAGHLYYHFKGKPQILAELMAAHVAEMEMVLEAARFRLDRFRTGRGIMDEEGTGSQHNLH